MNDIPFLTPLWCFSSFVINYNYLLDFLRFEGNLHFVHRNKINDSSLSWHSSFTDTYYKFLLVNQTFVQLQHFQWSKVAHIGRKFHSVQHLQTHMWQHLPTGWSTQQCWFLKNVGTVMALFTNTHLRPNWQRKHCANRYYI